MIMRFTLKSVGNHAAVKILKIGVPITISIFVLKMKQFVLYKAVMQADEMANSVDPDQTAPEGAV